MRLLKIIFCKHNYDKFVMNVHGDGINFLNGARSIWECSKCGKNHYSGKLHDINE